MAYLGGSAFAMARDVSEGYILLNANILKRMSGDELKQLRFEVERLLTSVRSEQFPSDDVQALQVRNRRISRLHSAATMISTRLLSLR